MFKRKRDSDKTGNSDQNSLVDVTVGLNSSCSSEKAEYTEEKCIETIASDRSKRLTQFFRLLVSTAFRAGVEFDRSNPNAVHLEQAIDDTFNKMCAYMNIEDLASSSPENQRVDLKTYTPDRDRSDSHEPITISKSIIICLANDFFNQFAEEERTMASREGRLSTTLINRLHSMIAKELEKQLSQYSSQLNLNIANIRQDIKKELTILKNIRINEEALYFSEEDRPEGSLLPSTTSASSSLLKS